MRVVVIGGTGLIGSSVSNKLRDHGHEVHVASSRTGVNTITGVGLDRALEGATVVVDVTNTLLYGYEDSVTFFTRSTRNILEASAAAGVDHHVALSILGAHRVTTGGYLRAKGAQENLVLGSAVPHTIVRSTLLFEFVRRMIDHVATTHQVRLPPLPVQPLAAADLASVLASVAFTPAENAVVEVAGPHPYFLDDLARRVLAADGDPRPVVADHRAPYLGSRFEAGDEVLLPTWRHTATTFEDWLRPAPPTPPRA